MSLFKNPWPFLGCVSAFIVTISATLFFFGFLKGDILLLCGMTHLIIVSIAWWGDVINEATLQGCHTKNVQFGLRLGMVLFIISEVMFFFAFFWAFFHSSIAPSVEIGACWPPVGIKTLDTYGIPLTNTFVLLTSGASVTWAHHALVKNKYEEVRYSLIITILYAFFFTSLQFNEYLEAHFAINDSVYGSTFYLITGFHGFHVIIGTIFICVCYFRHCLVHYTAKRHIGFEMAIWYWHFVDVIWIFVFFVIYWWGNKEIFVHVNVNENFLVSPSLW
jgi:cytochrome c oxidase subunit 3